RARRHRAEEREELIVGSWTDADPDEQWAPLCPPRSCGAGLGGCRASRRNSAHGTLRQCSSRSRGGRAEDVSNNWTLAVLERYRHVSLAVYPASRFTVSGRALPPG